MITNLDEALNLMRYFPGSFINSHGEIIISEKGNVYFYLDRKTDRSDFILAIFEWCSRDVVKGRPYNSDYYNRKWRNDLRLGFNSYIDKDLSEDEWEIIYAKLGHFINHKLATIFVENNFDFGLLGA